MTQKCNQAKGKYVIKIDDDKLTGYIGMGIQATWLRGIPTHHMEPVGNRPWGCTARCLRNLLQEYLGDECVS